MCTENLNPDILVMESAEDVERFDTSGSLNRARNWCIFAQRLMRSDVVIVACVRSQDPAQMRLTKNDDMIQTLAANRSDQPFGEAILPRRSWCGRPVPDAHGAQSASNDAAIDPVAIADEVRGASFHGNASVI